jgi:predicted secreted hydrolase
MLVFGLVHGSGWEPPDHGWEPPEDEAPKRREWDWHMLPLRSLAWLAVWAVLMALVPWVSSAFGGLAGFVVLMVAVALAFWRLERFCARQYWNGLREYKL